METNAMGSPQFKCRGVDIEVAANERLYLVQLAASAEEEDPIWLLDGKSFKTLPEALKYIGIPKTSNGTSG